MYICWHKYKQSGMHNIILFGPPGSGKGTQSKFIAQNYTLSHLSTGDLLRREIRRNTTLGNQSKALIDAGKLVPDDIVISLVRERLSKFSTCINGFIFDGFPRTTDQALALDAILQEHNTSIDQVIYLKVPKNELFKRLLERGQVSHRSDDANALIIKERIKEYKKKTRPILNYYKEQNKYYPIKGVGNIDDICNAITSCIEEYMKNGQPELH
jgi:adenylate kinase